MPEKWTIASAEPETSTGEIWLTSCATEDLGVILAKVRPAVVYLHGPRKSSSATEEDPTRRWPIIFTPSLLTGDRMGSGIIVDSRGFILSNYHVIREMEEIHVRLFGQTDDDYVAEIVAQDEEKDLAVLRIDVPFALPTAKLGNSDMLEEADEVLAVGCPFSLEQSVTHGIISDRKRSLTIEGRQYEDLLQTDAKINSGNSGGALIDVEGNVVGINVAIYAPDGVYCGVSFAIPVNQAKLLLMKIRTS